MQNTWLSLVPPLVVIGLVFLLRRLNISLIIGILVACLIAAKGSIVTAYSLLTQRLCQQITDIDNLFLYSFLFTIGILAALITTTGGIRAFAYKMTQKIKTGQAVQTSSFFLSLLLFIDDYLSILTVGYVMRPLIDSFAIARPKLAFLVHSLSGSVVILTPVSSWVTAITGYLEQAGIGTDLQNNVKILGDPLFIYLKTIPYIFYSFIIIGSVWFIIHARISFGPMKKYEMQAQPVPIDATIYAQTKGTISDLLLPLGTLLSLVFIGILYMGNYYLLGGTNSLIDAFKNNQYTFQILSVAGIAALIIGFTWALIRNVLSANQVSPVLREGFWLMYSPVVMVFLASTLGLLLRNDLMTGNYLASLLLGTVSTAYLPVLFFLVSLAMGLITGTAWGTFALLIYIAIPMITSMFTFESPVDPSALPILFPILGAIFSGGVCGDHISPISETTIMSATSAEVEPLVHSSTQLPYAIPAIIGSTVSFLLIGLLNHLGTLTSILISLSAGLIISCTLLWILNQWYAKCMR